MLKHSATYFGLSLFEYYKRISWIRKGTKVGFRYETFNIKGLPNHVALFFIFFSYPKAGILFIGHQATGILLHRVVKQVEEE